MNISMSVIRGLAIINVIMFIVTIWALLSREYVVEMANDEVSSYIDKTISSGKLSSEFKDVVQKHLETTSNIVTTPIDIEKVVMLTTKSSDLNPMLINNAIINLNQIQWAWCKIESNNDLLDVDETVSLEIWYISNNKNNNVDIYKMPTMNECHHIITKILETMNH